MRSNGGDTASILDEERQYKHQMILLQTGMISQMMHVMKSPHNILLIPLGVKICKKIKRQSKDNNNDDDAVIVDGEERVIDDNMSDLSDIELEIDTSLFKLIRIYQVLNRYSVFEAMIQLLMHDDDSITIDVAHSVIPVPPIASGGVLYHHLDVVKEYLLMIDNLVDTNRYSKAVHAHVHHQHPKQNQGGGFYSPDTPFSNTYTTPSTLGNTPNNEQNTSGNANANTNANANANANRKDKHIDGNLYERYQQQMQQENEQPILDSAFMYKIQINNKSYALEYASKHGSFLFWLLRSLTHLLKYVSSNKIAPNDASWVRNARKEKMMEMLMRAVVVMWRLSVYHKPASHLVEKDGVTTIIDASRYIHYSTAYDKRVLLIGYYLKIICNMLGADKRTWRDLTNTDGYHVLKSVINSLSLSGKEAHTMQSDWIQFEQAIVDKCLPLAIEYMSELNTAVSQELWFLTSGTFMRQHTMSAPLSVRARMKVQDQDANNSTGRQSKDKKNRKQHMVHNVNIRIELQAHPKRIGGVTDDALGEKERRREEEEERLIAKHLKKQSMTEKPTSNAPSPRRQQGKNTPQSTDDKIESQNGNHTKGTHNHNNRWRIWVIIESQSGEVYEHFPMDWVENILPGNKHILLSNCDKSTCFMIVYLYVFQSIKLKRKHVCLECLNEKDCHLWTHALHQLLKVHCWNYTFQGGKKGKNKEYQKQRGGFERKKNPKSHIFVFGLYTVLLVFYFFFFFCKYFFDFYYLLVFMFIVFCFFLAFAYLLFIFFPCSSFFSIL
ncbi:hypothetical protein RFI_14552 [Reticulomyxa filosa]|uniref:PH domain-containing protein n=1 Tax=Reticulomyxa filosa TaxID=46433 RepID=X6N8M2_RETFI|nr:hypothetical protein RFI_14552 [Reticulomyxa filosa]|eukprot:ETO22640.1 hypothetical protein RFI_14552 [Reticulomyxa filosa]